MHKNKEAASSPSPIYRTYLTICFLATTVKWTLFSSPSSTAAPPCTQQRSSTPLLASGPHRNLTTARDSKFNISKLIFPHLYRTQLILKHVYRNILKLMNAFNYPENNITENNYDTVLTHLNNTNPDIIQGLNLQTCDMQKVLSQVRKRW